MKIYHTRKDVAEFYIISVKTVDRLIRKLDIPIIRIGGQISIPETSLEFFIDNNSKTQNERQEFINHAFGG